MWNEIFTESKPWPFPPNSAPWKQPVEVVTRMVPAIRQAGINEQKLKAVEFLDNLDTRFTIFTDGTALNGTSDGGAGCFIEKTGETISLAAGELCSSYQAERVALKEAMHYLSTNKFTKARIVTDSLSLVQRVPNLENMKQWNIRAEKEVFETLVDLRDSMKDPVEILWCPCHCGVDGNATADKAAADRCHLPQAEQEVPFDSATNVIKKKLKWRCLPAHDTAAVYLDNERAKKYPRDKNLIQREQTTIFRLRSDDHPELKGWRVQNGTSG